MSFWNNRNKIEFFHTEPSIIENFPIIESKDLKLQWAKKIRENFENHVKSGTTTKPYFAHLARCPGIFDLFKYGYVVPLQKDVIIGNFSGKEFDWKFMNAGPVGGSSRNEYFSISGFDEEVLDLLVKPPWSADFIIKIDTGWNVITPKGVKFIMLPISYPDTFDFTATTGILNPTISTQINFQMLWNATEPETIIKAGTPLGHLIPLSEKKYQMVQRIANQQDRDWVAKLDSTNASTFWQYTIRKKIVNMYHKHWKR
jgi:hypothetical protein